MPNVWMAHSLTGPGVRSMTAEPTAVRESADGPERDGDQLGDAERDGGGGDACQRRCGRASARSAMVSQGYRTQTNPKALP